MKKVIIIGAGPAGITAGIYLTRAKIDNIVITNNSGSLKKAELVENYYGFENPISGSDLINNGINQYKRLGGNLIEDEIVSLTYEDKLKVIGVKDSYYCDIVIIATGAGRLMPNIKGLKEEKGVHYDTELTVEDLKELVNYYDQRIVSRILGNFEICRFFGNDLRLQRK